MQGLKLSKKFFDECARPILQDVPFLMDKLAVGLVGEGSECFGFDDEYSQDHDFGASLCFWLPQEAIAPHGDDLMRAVERMPATFEGFQTRVKGENGRTGLIPIEAFYQRFLGPAGLPKDWRDWMRIPPHYLAVCTNGEVFHDGLGAFTATRNMLLEFYPEDVRLKRLAARCFNMAQAGQYNLPRTLKRGERVAALMAAARFAEETLGAIFLLNKRYCPFYKWSHHAVKHLPVLGEYAHKALLMAGVPPEQDPMKAADIAKDAVEDICVTVADYMRKNGLSDEKSDFLLDHPQSIHQRIQNPDIKRLQYQTG